MVFFKGLGSFRGYKGLGKLLVVGVFALALSLTAGGVSAASGLTATTKVYNISLGTKLDLSSLLSYNVQMTPQPVAVTANYASQVVKLVNQQRAKAGLKALQINSKLSSSAMVKAKDMKRNHYFSHTSPVDGSPFALMKKLGIRYHWAGENIAVNQRTPQEVMKDWMNSKGHRANVMNKNYKSIGVAYYQGEWVQHFMG